MNVTKNFATNTGGRHGRHEIQMMIVDIQKLARKR
jgi:hypothetical protein